MRFKEFLEAVEADPEMIDRVKAGTKKKLIATKPNDEKADGNKTAAALNLKDLLAKSKRMGHTTSVAHAMGIYPA
jgi:hypothetical protein